MKAEGTGQTQATQMLDAFTGVGADRFHVTFTDINGQETGFLKNRTAPSMRYNLPAWMKRAGELKSVTLPATDNEPAETIVAGENLIIRPYTPQTSPPVVLVQLDDLKALQHAAVKPAAFLTLQTSPGNYQAWLAIQDADRDFISRLKRGIGADMSASGSVRMAGTGNFKRKYSPDFPTVAIEQVHSGRIVTPLLLETMGLVEPASRKPAAPASPLRCSNDRPTRLAWPDYQRCLEEMLAKGQKRSAADFYFACIAADRFKRTPEEIADKLIEVSSKAKENGHDYAIGQAERAAERVAIHPYTRSR